MIYCDEKEKLIGSEFNIFLGKYEKIAKEMKNMCNLISFLIVEPDVLSQKELPCLFFFKNGESFETFQLKNERENEIQLRNWYEMINKDLGFDLPKINEIFNDKKDQRSQIKNLYLEIIQSFEDITKKTTNIEDKKNEENFLIRNFIGAIFVLLSWGKVILLQLNWMMKKLKIQVERRKIKILLRKIMVYKKVDL